MPAWKQILKIGLIALIAVAAVIATVSATLYIAHRTGYGASHSDATCKSGQHTTRKVTIQGNTVTPEHTQAVLCDKLTITNLDNVQRLVAFGQHDNHKVYDGVEEKILNKNQSLTVTLVESGEYTFHDHIHDDIHGTFSVQR